MEHFALSVLSPKGTTDYYHVVPVSEQDTTTDGPNNTCCVVYECDTWCLRETIVTTALPQILGVDHDPFGSIRLYRNGLCDGKAIKGASYCILALFFWLKTGYFLFVLTQST